MYFVSDVLCIRCTMYYTLPVPEFHLVKGPWVPERQSINISLPLKQSPRTVILNPRMLKHQDVLASLGPMQNIWGMAEGFTFHLPPASFASASDGMFCVRGLGGKL